MKILVVGAGATYAEAENLGVKDDSLLPPLMGNFIRHMLSNTAPGQYCLKEFLESRGYTVTSNDGRNESYELEERGDINVEQLLAFCWQNRKMQCDLPDSAKDLPKGYISGLGITCAGDDSTGSDDESMRSWNDILYHGIATPLVLKIISCFRTQKAEWKEFSLSKKIISYLNSGDIVLNLNYDPVFELALNQAGKVFTYAPGHNISSYTTMSNYGETKYTVKHLNCIIVCKPHGSLNMIVDESCAKFGFQAPEFLYPAGCYKGLIPPRLDKTYAQHPFAKVMLDSIEDNSPSEIIFWGVGFTESDIDLIKLYKNWLGADTLITIINPDENVRMKVECLLSVKRERINYCKNVDVWWSSIQK